MKLTAAELTQIAQTLHDTTAVADRGNLFTWPRDTRLKLANRIFELLQTVEIDCLQSSASTEQK